MALHGHRLRTEHGAKWLDPTSLASVAAGGASRRQLYEWLKSDLSGEAQQQQEETRGRPRALSEDQESLLVGFAISTRTSLQALALTDLERFCTSYLSTTPSLSTLSRIMSEHGFTSQKLSRNSRMVSPEVVEDALAAIEEIRSFNFPPHRIIAMDETGLWSNVTAPRTYHFKKLVRNRIFKGSGSFGGDPLLTTRCCLSLLSNDNVASHPHHSSYH
jgi:hypothetical protein